MSASCQGPRRIPPGRRPASRPAAPATPSASAGTGGGTGNTSGTPARAAARWASPAAAAAARRARARARRAAAPRARRRRRYHGGHDGRQHQPARRGGRQHGGDAGGTTARQHQPGTAARAAARRGRGGTPAARWRGSASPRGDARRQCGWHGWQRRRRGAGPGGSAAGTTGGRAARHDGRQRARARGGAGGGTASNCVDDHHLAGYASPPAMPCSACMENGMSRETPCKAMLDCLEASFPCTGNCYSQCRNYCVVTAALTETCVMALRRRLPLAPLRRGALGRGAALRVQRAGETRPPAGSLETAPAARPIEASRALPARRSRPDGTGPACPPSAGIV